MTLKLFELVGTDASRPFSPFCWRTRMALAHKGLSAETIPWCFTEKDAIAPHGSEKVPVLLDGDTAVVNSWTIANYLEDNYPDRPSLFGGEGGRAMGRMLNWWGDGVIGGMFPLIIADIPLESEAGGRRLFPQVARGAFRQAAGRNHGRPRQGGRRLSQIARPAAADAEDAGLSRRRRSRTMPTISCSARSSGRGWSARSSCWSKTIRSMPGASGCSTRSTAWRGSRQAITGRVSGAWVTGSRRHHGALIDGSEW